MPRKPTDPVKRREQNRRYYETHKALVLEGKRPGRGYEKTRHGPNIDAAWSAMWDQQRGCCYLCGDPLDRAATALDHDHRCCPRKRSCALCRRGLACDTCNLLIGLAKDDPERLRRAADNLATAIALVNERLRSAPQQQPLDGVGPAA